MEYALIMKFNFARNKTTLLKVKLVNVNNALMAIILMKIILNVLKVKLNFVSIINRILIVNLLHLLLMNIYMVKFKYVKNALKIIN